MKKDIEFPEVTDVKIAIARIIDDKGESAWYVYLINNKSEDINNCLVVSKAYENLDKSGRQTSVFRHSVQDLSKFSLAKLEAIDPSVFSFYNEFWVSFYIGSQMFDKKFLVLPFNEGQLEDIPELEAQGRYAQL